MYVFDKGKTLKYTQEGSDWLIESRHSTMESAGNKISAVLPKLYKRNLDTFLENRKNWRNVSEVPDILPGKLCKLTGSNVYRLVKKINNENFDICLIKAEELNEPDEFLDLSESECEKIGVKYRKGLIALKGWTVLKPYDPIVENYDPDNLETYETSSLTDHRNTIRHMILRLSGFKRTDDPGIIKTPGGRYIDVELFLISLKVSYKRNIPGFSGMGSRSIGDDISWCVIYESFSESSKAIEGDICDTSGCIYLILDLTREDKGLKPPSFEGLKASDVFEVTWDVSFSNKSDEKAVITKSKQSVLFEDNIFVEKKNIYWRAINENNKYVPLVKQRE